LYSTEDFNDINVVKALKVLNWNKRQSCKSRELWHPSPIRGRAGDGAVITGSSHPVNNAGHKNLFLKNRVLSCKTIHGVAVLHQFAQLNIDSPKILSLQLQKQNM